MKKLMKRALAAGVVAMFAGGVAEAHPRLLSSTPPANATIAAPGRLVLRFSEKLIGPLARADLVRTGAPGVAKVATAIAVDHSGKQLIVSLRQKLPAGRYQLNWRAVSVDTHRVQGSIAFTVR